MKKFILASLGFCFIWHTAMASAVPSGSFHHYHHPNLRVVEFLNLSARDLEKLTGQKMNLGARVSFRILKAKMRKAVKKDPAITVNEFMNSQKKRSPGMVVLIILLAAILVFFIFFIVFYPGDR